MKKYRSASLVYTEPTIENNPPIKVNVTALPRTIKTGLSLCPIDPASIGGRIGSMHGVRADKKPEKKTNKIVGWVNSAVTSLTIEISII
jgi:hypothetical protein